MYPYYVVLWVFPGHKYEEEIQMAKNVQLDAKGYRKFGMIDNIAYAAGDFGCNMSFALKGTLFIFWTQFMQMDPLVYSGLFLLCQIWDAINDPLIGTIIDNDKRTTYKRGKFLAYIWLGSLGLLVAGACMFLPLPNLPSVAKSILFVAGYVLWDAFYTVANVPYGSLLSLISEDSGDRASLSAFRSVGGLLGNILPMVLLPFLMYENNVMVGQRVFFTALIMGVMGFLSFQFMIRNTVIRVETNVAVGEDAPKFNILKAMGNFLKNRPAVGATVAAMGMFIGQSGAASAVTVMFQSYFKDVTMSGIVGMFSMIPIILFTPLARKMVDKFGKKELSSVGAVISLVATVAFLVMPVPANMTGVFMYIGVMFVYSMGLGIYSTVSWALMGDAIDYNEWKTGAREEGTVYSLHSFFRKLAQGVGPSLCGVLMTMLGYTGNATGETMEVATNIRYLVSGMYLFAAICMFVGLALINNLDKKTLAKMSEELNARKAK